MNRIDQYLQQVDEVISKGPYSDDWESLKHRKIPEWFSKGKFGLFIHWGCYSVPACETEWYPRQMYRPGTESFAHKEAHYGKNADYRQIVEQFNPQKFDADEWLDLFQKSGAQYIMPVGEHHDGVKMYESGLNRWNTMQLAPHRDFMAELHRAADARGMGFLLSNHRAEHYWFLNGARQNFPDSEALGEEYRDLYGPCALGSNGGAEWDSDDIVPTEEWLRDWLASACEMVDRNRPRGVYFDWWIQRFEFRPYLKKFLAYYYNRAAEWGVEPVVFYKYNAIMQGCGVFDVERGQVQGVAREPWQCDTSLSWNSWGFTEGNRFKSANDCLCNLIDVISKNGCLMLNVGPRPDGSICEEERALLLEIGAWMEKNGEAVYGTEPFTVYGEGAEQKSGAFEENPTFTAEDYRFTYRCGAIYAFVLAPGGRREFRVKSLCFDNNRGITYPIAGVSLLGSSQPVEWEQDASAMTLRLPEADQTGLPLCFKIAIG